MMTSVDFNLFLHQIRIQIDNRLSILVPEHPETEYFRLFNAARYSLLGEGKRLRPILTLLTAETFGATSEQALNSACALEMIHCYSLIHDDLPCMDDDDYRRGRLSLHKAFDEGHAVLAADYLLTDAFGVIANDPALTPTQKISLISLLANNAGSGGMISGQILDIEGEGKQLTLDQLNQIHRYKTGALITTAIEFGGIIACASKVEMDVLNRFGSALGLAFQIIDDVLDVTASEDKHGKKISSDIVNQKVTYVSLLGLEASRQKALELLKEGCSLLASLDRDTKLLQELAQYIVDR